MHVALNVYIESDNKENIKVQKGFLKVKKTKPVQFSQELAHQTKIYFQIYIKISQLLKLLRFKLHRD